MVAWTLPFTLMINEQTKYMLEIAHQFCDDEDKSTEFMIEYMQDFANTDLDTVIEYLESKAI